MSLKDSQKLALKQRANMQATEREIHKATINAEDYARRGDMKSAEREQDRIRQLTEEMINYESGAIVAERLVHEQREKIKELEAREKAIKAEYEQKMNELERERSETIGGMTNMY